MKELTTRVARGDRDAFAAFYSGWFDPMYAEARRVTRADESFCLDVVQDAMIRVIRSLKPVESERQLATWLKTVVRTSAYDRLREAMRRKQREDASTGRNADRRVQAERLNRLDWLRGEIASMDGPNARLLVMRYRLGWTLEQIGGILGVGPGAIDGRIRRALAGLKGRAKETFDE